MSEKSTTFLPLSLSLSAAVIMHCLLFALVYFLDLPNILDKNKTVPIVLVSPTSTASSPNKMSKNQNSLAAQEFLNTLNSSHKINNQTPKEKTESQNNVSKPNSAPDVLSPEHHQNYKSNNAISDFQNIFTKSNTTSKSSEKKQISSKKAEQLSDYEVKLLNALAKESLYDAFHPIMAKYNTAETSYKIKLALFPNGAIKKAEVAKSSGNKEIDQLAVQSAYRASPFPAPPSEDIAVRYQYTIPIIYKRK